MGLSLPLFTDEESNSAAIKGRPPVSGGLAIKHVNAAPSRHLERDTLASGRGRGGSLPPPASNPGRHCRSPCGPGVPSLHQLGPGIKHPFPYCSPPPSLNGSVRPSQQASA